MGICGTASPKPARGTYLLERRKAKAEAKANEDAVRKAVQKRDVRCRWPEPHVCVGGPLEAAHILDKSLCGPTIPENEILLCPWIHRRGPDSIHGKQLKVEKETAAGANGPLSFWRRSDDVDALGQPIYFCVARERAIGVIEKD